MALVYHVIWQDNAIKGHVTLRVKPHNVSLSHDITR